MARVQGVTKEADTAFAYDEVIAADPGYKWAHASRAQSLRLLGRLEHALSAIDRALQIDPGYEWARAERGAGTSPARRCRSG